MLPLLGKAAELSARASWAIGRGVSGKLGKGMKSSYKRKSIWPMLIILMQPVLLIFLLWVLFAPIDGEEADVTLDAFITNTTVSYNTTKWDFKAEIAAAEARADELKNLSTTSTFDYSKMNVNIKLNDRYSPLVKQLNQRIFQSTYRYFNPDVVKHIPAEYADPLIIMAFAVVENSGWGCPSLVWTPALPLQYIEGCSGSPSSYSSAKVIPDMVDTYGLLQLKDNENFWDFAANNPLHQGALQMTPTYGVWQAMQPSDLKSSEAVRFPGIYKKLPASGDKIGEVSAMNSGDRYNWLDAVNRTAGVMDDSYRRHLSNKGISKQAPYSIDNIYSFMAYMGMIHQYSGIPDTSDENSIGNWTKSKYSRQWANALGKPDVLAIIQGRVDKALESYKTTGRLSVGYDEAMVDEAIKLAEDNGYIERGTLADGNHGRQIKRYPVVTIYSYLLLRGLYQGG